MRAYAVVVDPPGFDRRLCVDQADKPVLVEAFIAKLAVEAFHVGVLDRLARANETQRDAVSVGPRIERASGKLRSVVDDDAPRQADRRVQTIKYARLVQFSEWMTPTILRSGSANRELRARGRVWIDDTSGRVAKTELDFGREDDPDNVITTFRFDDDLQVAVPVEMRERWRFRGSEVTSVATYGRFRRFGVQTEEKIR